MRRSAPRGRWISSIWSRCCTIPRRADSEPARVAFALARPSAELDALFERAADPAPADWALGIQRIRSELRPGEGFARTVGTYAVLHDGAAQAALSGMTVERQVPGDNGPVGKMKHRCIAAGDYPLRPHDSAKYKTTGYASDGDHP